MDWELFQILYLRRVYWLLPLLPIALLPMLIPVAVAAVRRGEKCRRARMKLVADGLGLEFVERSPGASGAEGRFAWHLRGTYRGRSVQIAHSTEDALLRSGLDTFIDVSLPQTDRTGPSSPVRASARGILAASFPELELHEDSIRSRLRGEVTDEQIYRDSLERICAAMDRIGI